jgi:ribosomal protein L11 methyltransferase
MRNGVADRVRITDDPPAADILVANILANALDELAPRFAALVHVHGRIALSGILPPQSAQLTARYACAFRMQPPREEQGWVLLAGRRLAR